MWDVCVCGMCVCVGCVCVCGVCVCVGCVCVYVCVVCVCGQVVTYTRHSGGLNFKGLLGCMPVMFGATNVHKITLLLAKRLISTSPQSIACTMHNA